MNRINYRVNEMDAGKLLKDVIKTRMDVSKRLIKRLKAHPEGILVNGQHRTVRYVVEVGDEISLAMAPSEKDSDIIHEMKPLTVVYEDDMVLVVDKPPGVTMFPRRRGELGSLAGAVLAHLEANGEACIYHPVSRLDIGTSGLVLLAKNSYAAGQLSKNRAKKYYQCFVYGRMLESVHLEGHICESAPAVRQTIGPLFYVGDGGKICSTFAKPLYYDENLKATAVWVRIDTGRRHQIRVHLSHQGHPLIGDVTYGGPSIRAKRPLLHAAALTYRHPQTGEKMHHFLGMHSYGNEPEEIKNQELQVDLSEMR